jgi:hypothetical protein
LNALNDEGGLLKMKLKSMLIAFLILASTLFILLSPAGNTSAVTPVKDGNPVQYLDGDWAVVGLPEEYEDKTFYLNGNLTSWDLLTLINTTLNMNSTAGSTYNINIYSANANLTLKDNSKITATNPLYRYDLVFNSLSRAYIKDSEISYAGYPGGISEGILIKSDSVLFENSKLLNNYNAIVCHTASPVLVSSEIASSVNKDMMLKGNSHPVAINTTLDKSNIEVSDTSSLTIKWYLTLEVVNQTDAPISDARVTVRNSTGSVVTSQFTDANGWLKKIVLTECVIHPDRTVFQSPYTIELTKDGYNSYFSQEINITNSLNLKLKMTPKPTDGMIAGVVTDEDDNPIDGAVVSVVKDDKEIAVGYSNSTGHYNISDIPEDVGYIVYASSPPDYGSENNTGVSVTGNTITTVDFQLLPLELPVSIFPEDGVTDVDVDTTVVIVFEEEINASSLEAYFELKSNTTGQEVLGSWNTTDNLVFVFRPSEPLTPGEGYFVRIYRHVKNLTDEKPLWMDFNSYFQTSWGPPIIKLYQPVGADIGTDAEIIIAFDQTMNRKSVEDAIKIPQSGILSFQWSTFESNPDASVKIIFSMSEGVTYNITLGTSARTIHDVNLEKALSWEFTTMIEITVGSLVVEIVDENGDPVSGVNIEIIGSGFSTQTNTNGYFAIGDIPQGNYYVTISSEGFKSREEGPIPITPGLSYDMQSLTLERDVKAKADEKEDEEDTALMAAYSIMVILILIILVLFYLIATSKKPDEIAGAPEERVDYMDLGYIPSEGESEGEGEGEGEQVLPGPEYRGRCPVCKHLVYGDAGCFHCASGGGSYSYADEGQ